MNRSAESYSNCMMKLSLRQPETSENFVPAKTDLDIKILSSIESFLISCFKEVISLNIMAQEESQFTDRNSGIRILTKNTIKKVFSQWPMQVHILMVHNSLLQLLYAHGSMGNTSFSEKLSKVTILFNLLKVKEHTQERLQSKLVLPIVENIAEHFDIYICNSQIFK
jgi:hypothetical protein